MSQAMTVKAAIFAALPTLSPLVGIQIAWGLPPRDTEATWILIGDITWDSNDWATNRTREEKFKISVICETQVTAASAQDVELAVMVLSDAMEAVFKASPGFDLPGIVTSNYTPGRLVSWPADTKYAAQVHGEIGITARF